MMLTRPLPEAEGLLCQWACPSRQPAKTSAARETSAHWRLTLALHYDDVNHLAAVAEVEVQGEQAVDEFVEVALLCSSSLRLFVASGLGL